MRRLLQEAPTNEKRSHRSTSVGDLPLVACKSPLNKRSNTGQKFPTLPNGVTNSKLPELVTKTCPIGKKMKKNSRFRYRLLPGNNVRVVLGALRRRPWWNSMPRSDDSEDCSSLPTFLWEMYRNPVRYSDKRQYRNVMLNHLQNNNCLVAKKGLYFCLKTFCERKQLDLLQIVPRTFFLSADSPISETSHFLDYNKRVSEMHTSRTKEPNAQDSAKSPTFSSEEDIPNPAHEGVIWILKPASKTNRGFGIKVVQGVDEVMKIVERRPRSRTAPSDDSDLGSPLGQAAETNAKREGWIVQEYMLRPLLVKGRKFDIRCFVLLTQCSRQGVKAYFFDTAYVRTSSKKYTLNSLSDRETHLTNDAVQKNSKAYGKFESGNKLTFEELQGTIEADYPGAPKNVVMGHIMPQIKRLSALSVEAASEQLVVSDINKSFELLGYDYMVNEDFDPVLIEINSNPCLEFACPLLTDIISALIENVVKVALDPVFVPPVSSRTKACQQVWDEIQQQETRFEQIFPS